MIFLTTLIASVLLTAVTVPLASRLALRYNLVDLPNDRKVHSRPIPRVGGLAMALGAFVPLVYWVAADRFVAAYLAGAALLLLFGFWDDYHDLSPRWKLVGQGVAALIAVYGGGVEITYLGLLAPDGFVLPVWCAVPLTVLIIVGVTNAINLSDGLDGLAGGISLLCLCCISFLAYVEGDSNIALIALALSGATFGFLRFNSFPATIFMGDAGSQVLGYSAIILSLKLTQGNTALSPVLPLIILGFPVLDTLTVMTGRIARGRSPFSADKTHFHHSLLALGLHQTESVLVIYVIQVSLIVVAFMFRFYSDWLLLGGYLLFCAAVLALFTITRSRGWEPKRAEPLRRGKLYLRWLRDRTSAIKYLFQGLCLLYPALLVVTFAISGNASGPVALTAAGIVALMVVVRYFLVARLEYLLYAIIYLVVPYGVYHSEHWIADQPPAVGVTYNLLFGLVVLLNILVSKLTRRSEGFKSTPLDFLIFFLALAPLLPQACAPDFRLGLVAAKIIILYYGCEVLMAELRGSLSVVAGGIAAAMAMLVLRWFW